MSERHFLSTDLPNPFDVAEPQAAPPEHHWIGPDSDAGVVLATLVSGLFRDIDAGWSTDLQLGYLREALDEYYAERPHLTPRHKLSAEVAT